jgi:hypothetical protein
MTPHATSSFTSMSLHSGLHVAYSFQF